MLALGNQQKSEKAQPAAQRRAHPEPSQSTPAPLNPVWQTLATRMQTKLGVNTPGDKYEQEADRVAEEVLRMPLPQHDRAAPFGNSPPTIQRRCTECEEELHRQPIEEEQEEETIQAKETSSRTPKVTPDVQAQINGLRGSGQPLPESVHAFFRPRFGQDFSNVLVHTDARAAEAARAVNAQAFTVGRDVVFGAGAYAPGAVGGRRLLAHELTHVLQQRSDRVSTFLQRQPTTPEPPASVIHERIDVRAQFALQRLFKGPDAPDAIALFNDVDSGKIKGIFGDDLGIAARLAAKRGTVRWELVPEGADAVWLEDDAPDAEVDTPAIIFKQAAARPAGRLDQALLKVYQAHQETPIFKPPTGVKSPTASMSGKWVFAPRAGDDPNPHLTAGIEFPTKVSGSSDTKGWAFHVQNIMNRVDMVRIARGDQSKICHAEIPSQVLDTGYPYSELAREAPDNPAHPSVVRFIGVPLTKKITTSDGPIMSDPEGQNFEVGDRMTLSTTQSYRMFIVWDPNTKATLPTRNEAHPISLGFVDWGWAAAASFQRISDFDTGGWKFQEDSLVKNTRPESPVFTKTPGGARVEINKVATGDQLDEGLKKNCAKKN